MRTLYREMAGVTALGVALGGCLLPSAAAAQMVRHEVNMLPNADGTPGLDLRTVRPNGFQLFAAGDAALAGGRSTGNHGWSYSNYGDCSNVLHSCQTQRMVRATGGNVALWFYNSWIAGAPPSQWSRIRDVAPSVTNALGGGYTAGFNEELTGGFIRFGPADRTLGRLFAGVASTNDGSCFDNTGFGNGSVPAGIPLLAQSVCAETWGAAGWQGARRSTLEDWVEWAARQGATFTFDFWRLPDDLKQNGFIGTGQQMYGETTDYYEDILGSYGSVIPGGTGAPIIQGYPLGLKIRFDVFGFTMPSVSSVKFVRALVINRSEDVWGRGVDYDSLYFGMSPGDLGSASSGTAHYYLPEMGAIVRVVAGANTAVNPCNDSFREPVFGCAPSNGWRLGSQAIVVLKSPIGDLRNKLYTRTASGTACLSGSDPFCGLRPDLAADTFTVNQGRMCGFGACNTFVWVAGGPRSGFGFLSGSENLTVNGRDINAATAQQAWSTFRSPVWPDRAHYSKWQPDPTWDYNKDGIPDTLSLTSCHLTGCVGLASDTLPGGFVNLSSNVGTWHGVGPFSLKAGDTTAFFYAVIGEQDSIATMSQVNATIDLYLNFFEAPTAPPPARVLSTQVAPATDALGSATPEVRVFFSDDPYPWTDPFLAKLVADMTAAAPGTPLADLRDNNPTLLADLTARVTDNLERIEIYKSCDGGNTFTGDGDCLGDPILDDNGVPVGLGWQPYQVLGKISQNVIPSSLTDLEVQGGRSYLYVIVGKTRGATFPVVPRAGAAATLFEFAPSLRNPLSRSTSDPNVVSVYVPASRAAGDVPASVSFTARPTSVTVPFAVEFSGDNVVAGSYSAIFGNRILVHRDSVSGAPAGFRTMVEVEHQVAANIDGTRVDTVISRVTVGRVGPEPFPFAGLGAVGTPFLLTGADTMRTTANYGGLGFVVVRGETAFFGSTTLTAAGTTPSALLRLPDHPGFVVTTDNTVAGTFNSAGEAHIRGPESIGNLRLTAADSITPRKAVNQSMPQFQEATTLSLRRAGGEGLYELTWTDDAFGQPQGFVINRTTPGATEAEVGEALRSRAAGTTGLTDAETAALTGIPQDELVAVRMPFTIRNVTYDRAVRVAMRQRFDGRIPLGADQDTISVEVPEDQWIPGDRLMLIEDVTSDSTIAFSVVLSGNTIVQVTHPTVTYSSAVIGCNLTLRLSCNPVALGSPGATGYIPIAAGDRTLWEYYIGFRPGTQFAFDVTAPIAGGNITAISDSALDLIRVVPNPFVVASTYQTTASEGRVLFTNLPPRGTLRIYTVAGQFTQQITWEPDDLEGAGDLFFNLRTRGGRDMASGLYLWVLQAPSDPSNPDSPPLRKAGKFVVIRGTAR